MIEQALNIFLKFADENFVVCVLVLNRVNFPYSSLLSLRTMTMEKEVNYQLKCEK